MITIEEIKEKLIELGFELEEQMIPKFDQFTGQPLPVITVDKQLYTLNLPDFYYSVVIDFTSDFDNNGILEGKYGISFYYKTKHKPIEPFWNLFLQLLEEHAK